MCNPTGAAPVSERASLTDGVVYGGASGSRRLGTKREARVAVAGGNSGSEAATIERRTDDVRKVGGAGLEGSLVFTKWERSCDGS